MAVNAIEASGLRKHFGQAKALDGLDLTVGSGEVHAFLGPNGAGKPDTKLRHSFRPLAVWVICPEPDHVSETLDDRAHYSIPCQGLPHLLGCRSAFPGGPAEQMAKADREVKLDSTPGLHST